MKSTSLGVVVAALLISLPEAARAADPPAAGSGADPFAPSTEGSEPASTEDQEAALLGAPKQPAEAPPTAAPPARRPPTANARARRAQANDDERSAAAAPASAGGDQSGIALELSTSGFASGTLSTGLFLGGRTASGLIIGGLVDYTLTSVTATPEGSSTDVTTSKQTVRLGVGVRFSFVQSADRLVDLYGAADVAFEYRGSEVPFASGSSPTRSTSASGFSLAVGPGLRLWVHDQIAIGYVARLRTTYLSGEAGALTAMPDPDTTATKATEVAFDGTFQILGIF